MMKWTKETPPVGQSEHEPELSPYQRAMRNRLLAAPVMPAPEPWRPVFAYEYGVPVGGLLGIGFATDPDTGHDLVMAVSSDGHGLFDAVTGEKIARDRDPAPEDSTPDAVADLSCPGLGPITGSRVRIAGVFGGLLHVPRSRLLSLRPNDRRSDEQRPLPVDPRWGVAQWGKSGSGATWKRVGNAGQNGLRGTGRSPYEEAAEGFLLGDRRFEDTWGEDSALHSQTARAVLCRPVESLSFGPIPGGGARLRRRGPGNYPLCVSSSVASDCWVAAHDARSAKLSAVGVPAGAV